MLKVLLFIMVAFAGLGIGYYYPKQVHKTFVSIGNKATRAGKELTK